MHRHVYQENGLTEVPVLYDDLPGRSYIDSIVLGAVGGVWTVCFVSR